MTTTASSAYQHAAVSSADSLQLTIMMHDMIIEDLRRCAAALRAGDIQVRASEAAHAIGVLDQLQRSLDMKHGGGVARVLSRIYARCSVDVVHAQAVGSLSLLEQQIDAFTSLRDAWRQLQADAAASPDRDPVPDSTTSHTWSV